ncbi:MULTISPECIES: TRAP transporter small permease [unclassified Pseudomonas]|jgi:C4-dicarboxylate transporter DctQ subunit|uniref:TRAP transporter small permease n=1 Tax=unclassified Pseudomonas TaxID=196821 RepID=UPI00131C38F4|nr:MULTISPECIES: TRAP transporter small permease [unclassified Pseudomonas]
MSNKLLAGLRKVIDSLIILLYGFMCVSILVQVIGRYVFNFSTGSIVEAATFAQVWMVMLAAGVAMRMNLHNAMDLLAQKLSRPVYRALVVVSAAACLWFLGVTLLGGLPLLEIGQYQTSPALEIPMSVPYYAIPVGCLYFALEILLYAVKRWRAGKPEEQALDQMEVN